MATFNPSSSSGTKISAVLFGEGTLAPPSTVFESNMDCRKIVNDRLVSLIKEMGNCLDNRRRYTSTVFPSLCGQLTSAVSALRVIHQLANNRSHFEGTVIIITDDTIHDYNNERRAVINDLNSDGINTIIAAGIHDASPNNLLLYASSQETVITKRDPVDLGVAIVQQLLVNGVLCQDYGNKFC